MTLKMNINWKEKGSVNFEFSNEITEEMPLKLEIKDEPENAHSFLSTECTDDRVETLSGVDDSEICHENTETIKKSQVCDKQTRRQRVTEGTSDYPAKYNSNAEGPVNTISQINDDLFVKSEIKDEPIDYKFAACASFSACEISCENSKIDIIDTKLGEDATWKEKGPTNFYSTRQINNDIYLKSEIKDEPMDDFSTEYVDNIIEPVSKVDCCEISCEDTKIDIAHTSGNFVFIRSAEVTDNVEEDSKNISVNNEGRKEENKTKFYQCEVCHVDFAQQIEFKKHKRLHTGEKSYQCDVCNKFCTQQSNLNSHKRTHTGEKPFECEICHKYFTRLETLNIHKCAHTGEKPHQCDVCNKQFSHLSYLNTHKRLHTGKRLYQCDVCNKCFVFVSNLTAHKRTHTGEKPYQCDVCKKRFTQSNSLNAHKRTHAGEKPYQCDVCNKCFALLSNLKTHKRTHTGEKPYQCDVCNKCFALLRNLNTHKRIHTGEKPYQCHVCSKRFSQVGHLNKHKLTHM